MSNKSGAAAIHSRLKHPVIDSDGHWIEFEPAALDYVKKVGGESLVSRFTSRTSHFGNRGWSKLTPEERSDRRMLQPLGLTSVMLGCLVRRRVKAAPKEGSFNRYAVWTDTLGIDSPCDYDPVWANCVELKINPPFHSSSSGLGFRTSPSNFVYNHIGHFGAAGEAVCKSLFLAGVTRRFPTLTFAFLEGGVGWGCTLYSDLIGHWKERNLKAVEATNPANLDFAVLGEMGKRYGAAP